MFSSRVYRFALIFAASLLAFQTGFGQVSEPADATSGVRNVQLEGVAGDGQSDVTSALGSIFQSAVEGQTIYFPKGKYVAAPGTQYVITKAIKIAGDAAELQNVRLLLLANVDVDGLTLTELDCTNHQHDPLPCPATGTMITLGYIGYPITHASFRNLTLDYTRAYTGIDMGYGPTENVTLQNVRIIDSEMSGVSIYGGSHIRISGSSITGGSGEVVDDGIAISSYYGPISDVVVTDTRASSTANLVGIGSTLYWPTTDISVTNSSCRKTIACIYIKLGDDSPLPSPYVRYSYLDGLTVDGVDDSDVNGDVTRQACGSSRDMGQSGGISRLPICGHIRATRFAMASG